MLSHFKSLGFTNRLALYVLGFLGLGLAGGFYLAMRSITADYSGSLLCWTIVFTPIGTAVGCALPKIVDKNKAENTSGGIVHDSAMADKTTKGSVNSPGI